MARKMSVTEMRAKCNDYFFSTNTRRFFRGSRTQARYDRAKGQNYLRVTSPRGTVSWYKFNARTGKTEYVSQRNLPEKLFKRKKG